MKEIKRWYAPKEGGYMVFVCEGFNSIVPQSDIRAHKIRSTQCPCKPRSSMDSDYLHIIHNSFEEEKALEESMKKIITPS